MNQGPIHRDNEEALICEALVREIGRATRWKAVVEAWDALLSVRRMAEELRKELQPTPPSAVGQGAANTLGGR